MGFQVVTYCLIVDPEDQDAVHQLDTLVQLEKGHALWEEVA